jgi:RNA methyltransferase, TrmH family
MLSNAQIKLIDSLEQKKYRKINALFIAEGAKIIAEILQAQCPVDKVYVTQTWIDENEELYEKTKSLIEPISEAELKKISLLSTPNQALALLPIFYPAANTLNLTQKITLALDNIQDPGNMGTILRIADWFGIENIICSENCVDVFNPKVIQASMGAFLRVKTYYTDLAEFLSKQETIPVYGALLQGENIYHKTLSKEGIIVLGNESNGISDEVKKHITYAVNIPRMGGAESLNVSIAAAIICSEFLRNN